MFSNLPPVTKALLIANGAVFLLQLAVGEAWFAPLMLSPIGAGFMPWQLLTYGFLHGNIAHLVFNMLFVLMFGAQIEWHWGAGRFLRYFLACVAGAGLCQLAFGTWWMHLEGVIYRTLGASGGVYGLIAAFGILFPSQRIPLFPLPLFVHARTMAMIAAVLALAYGILGTHDGVAHFAHLGGMLTGWLLLREGGGKPPFKKNRRSRRLRLIN